jgi:fucose permease
MNNVINHKNSIQSWLIVLTSALFFFYIFIQMNMFNAIGPSLIKTFGISTTQLGNLSAMYFYGNVIFLFPAALLLDYYSTRNSLVLVVAICVLSTFLFGHTTSLWQAIIAVKIHR